MLAIRNVLIMYSWVKSLSHYNRVLERWRQKHVQFPDDVDDAVTAACEFQQIETNSKHTLENKQHYHHRLHNRQLVESFACSDATEMNIRTAVLIDADGCTSAEETAPTTVDRNGTSVFGRSVVKSTGTLSAMYKYTRNNDNFLTHVGIWTKLRYERKQKSPILF